MGRNLATKLQKLSERIQKEKEQNIIIQKDYERKTVTYGSEVFLMHYDSESFINAKNDSTQTSKIGYDCFLSDWYAKAMTFKIEPKYKSRQDGEVIQYGDNVIFQNVKFKTYLSFTNDIIAEHDKELEMALNRNTFRMEQNIIDPLSKRYRVYLSQESETSWQINLFRNVFSKSAFISGLDLLYLKHTELNGYVSANLKYREKTDVYVRNYMGEFGDEEISTLSIWEIENNEFERRGEHFSMIETRHNSFHMTKSSVPFRLRHFISGKLLHCDKHTRNCYLSDVQYDIVGRSDYSLLQCEPILKHIEFLQQDFSYHIKDGGKIRTRNQRILSFCAF